MTTIFFVVSFIALICLILFRVIQNNFNLSFLSRIYTKTDSIMESVISSIFLKYNYFKKVGQIFVFEFLPALVYEFLVKSKDYVARRYYNSANEFRGRRMLRNDGSVSAFLEQLSGDK